MFADIIVDLSVEALDRSFQYIVPREMEDTIAVGMMGRYSFWQRKPGDDRFCSGNNGAGGMACGENEEDPGVKNL